MDYPWWYWLIVFAIDALLALWCGWFAERKGYSRLLFTVLGFLFFIITAVVILVLPSKRTA